MGSFVLAIDQGTTGSTVAPMDARGKRLIRPAVIETTVAGACYLAGLGVGLWRSPAEVRKIWQAEREFKVQMSAAARRKRTASWNTARQRTLL
jgi:glycerol kinase